MTWPDFRKVLSSSQILRTKNMSWENLSTMIHRNQAIFYALILSPTIHFVLALISRGAEGTWRFAGSSRHGRVKLQTPLWFTKPELVMMWKKKKRNGSWLCLGVVGNLKPVRISRCLQVLAEPASGSFVDHIEVVFVSWPGDSFSSKYLLLQFSVLLTSDVIC